jgi:hypothetical protein
MKIELGSKSPSPGCAPVSCCDSGEKMHYPSLYLSGSQKLDLPDEGTALISFKKVSSGMDQRDDEEPHYRCELEVHSIEVKGGKPKDDEPMGINVGNVLKEAMRRKMKKGEYEEEG